MPQPALNCAPEAPLNAFTFVPRLNTFTRSMLCEKLFKSFERVCSDKGQSAVMSGEGTLDATTEGNATAINDAEQGSLGSRAICRDLEPLASLHSRPSPGALHHFLSSRGEYAITPTSANAPNAKPLISATHVTTHQRLLYGTPYATWQRGCVVSTGACVVQMEDGSKLCGFQHPLVAADHDVNGSEAGSGENAARVKTADGRGNQTGNQSGTSRVQAHLIQPSGVHHSTEKSTASFGASGLANSGQGRLQTLAKLFSQPLGNTLVANGGARGDDAVRGMHTLPAGAANGQGQKTNNTASGASSPNDMYLAQRGIRAHATASAFCEAQVARPRVSSSTSVNQSGPQSNGFTLTVNPPDPSGSRFTTQQDGVAAHMHSRTTTQSLADAIAARFAEANPLANTIDACKEATKLPLMSTLRCCKFLRFRLASVTDGTTQASQSSSGASQASIRMQQARKDAERDWATMCASDEDYHALASGRDGFGQPVGSPEEPKLPLGSTSIISLGPFPADYQHRAVQARSPSRSLRACIRRVKKASPRRCLTAEAILTATAWNSSVQV